jgi:hypothetical protein
LVSSVFGSEHHHHVLPEIPAVEILLWQSRCRTNRQRAEEAVEAMVNHLLVVVVVVLLLLVSHSWDRRGVLVVMVLVPWRMEVASHEHANP